MKTRQQVLRLALLALAALASYPVLAHGNSHGQHHSFHAHSHYSRLPATTAPSRYCASTGRHVTDVRDCPEATIKSPNEIAVGTVENR